jgi:hypothetical protein
MKPWKKTYQAWYMSLDWKPRGTTKKVVNKITRAKLKQEARKEIKTYEPSSACLDEK